MTIILDTSILIGLEKNDRFVLSQLADIRKFHPMDPNIPFISYFEFISGLKNRKPHNVSKAIKFIEQFPFLKAQKETAKILADLKHYETKGIMLPLADLLIAAQAIENNMTLVTLDKGFERIEELKKIIL